MGLSRRTRFLSHNLVLALAFSAAACATNPVTGKKQLSFMSEDQEIRLGQELDAQVRLEMGVYEDSKLQQYVEDIGMRLAKQSQRPNLPWHFTIVDSPAINAFALPGGYIYITRGIVAHLYDQQSRNDGRRDAETTRDLRTGGQHAQPRAGEEPDEDTGEQADVGRHRSSGDT